MIQMRDLYRHRLFVGIITMLLFSSCTDFRSSQSRENHSIMSRAMHSIVSGRYSSLPVPDPTSGVLVVFTYDAERPSPSLIQNGETAAEAMYKLMARVSNDPCQGNGNRSTIVGFSYPPNVDLPSTFTLCSELYHEVVVAQEQARAINRLVLASNGNSTALNKLSADLSVISKTQDASWTLVLAMLKDMGLSLSTIEE